MTRGFHQLFNGDIVSALHHNLFVPVVLVAVVGAWWSWFRTSWGRSPVTLPHQWTRALAVGVPIVVVVYGVLRNVPAAPFSGLAPG